MFPAEREYRVGPTGFVQTTPEGVTVKYEPGTLVWLRSVPQGADLQPTGAQRNYQTKVRVRREAKRGHQD